MKMTAFVRSSHIIEMFFTVSRRIAQFLILFPFHPAVLEPDLDLPFRKTECLRNLAPSRTAQVLVKMELFFQL